MIAISVSDVVPVECSVPPRHAYYKLIKYDKLDSAGKPMEDKKKLTRGAYK